MVNLKFLKKIVKNQKLKISKIPKFCEDHGAENSGEVWKLLAPICRRSSTLIFSLSWGLMLMKTNKSL